MSIIPRQRAADPWTLSNGMLMQVNFGASVATNLWWAGVGNIRQQVRSYIATTSFLNAAEDFFANVQRENSNMRFDFYVWLPNAEANPVGTDVVRLAFDAICGILFYSLATGTRVARPEPLTAQSFAVYAANGVTPVLMGYLKSTTVISTESMR